MAERDGTSVYALLQRSVKAGVAALASPPARDTSGREIVAELAMVSTRMVDVERLLDRALFTACAAYCYARSAALALPQSDEAISEEINAAYNRQRRLAREDKR
ncbi:hypothetical protein [Novosphingobium sp. AAP1]|uniref:hypothetical protein n=1 Tax=Novosphingobium sp. AAP1 TaxID=1523413 RepID=UPI001E3A787D|nr:hypothetical protein [Novosphingobium sp. AAP1]